MPANRMDEAIGRVLDDRYRIIAPLGSGASARVFLADDTRLRRRVAIKLLHESLAEDETFLRRFETEAQVVAGLSHPHILAVHDWGFDDVPYLVTEYLSGGSLRQILDKGVLLSSSQALVVGLEAARALDYAHGRGLVHRDIKPDNLLFDSEGHLRIADFGLARALAESSVTEPSGTFLGSARYASPEQAKGSTLDGRSDVYSLALVLSESVTGTLPFDSDTQIGTLMARTEVDFDPGEELGPLRKALSRAGKRTSNERPDADGFAVAMMATAEQLPRPEPLPLAGAIDEKPVGGAEGDLTSIGGGAAIDGIIDDQSGAGDDIDQDGTAAVASSIPFEEPTHSRRETKVIARRAKQEARSERLLAIERGEVKRRRWPWAIVALLLIAAGGVGGWFAWSSSQVDPIIAPNLLGAQSDDLPGLLADFELTLTRPREVRQDGTTPGEVIAQDPVAGAEMQPGDALEVTVSLGEPLAPVPTDLVGIDIQAADLRLQAAQLVLGDVSEVFDETAPVGLVLEAEATLPDLERGSSIDLVISKGPAPRPVPDGLEGVTEEDAVTLIEAARLVAALSEEFSADVEEGFVISATPAAGTELEVGETVELVVSLGREPVVVPNVEGLNITEAQQILQDAGLVVSEIEGPPAEPVLTTDPPNGTNLFKGDEVVIFTIGAGDSEDGG